MTLLVLKKSSVRGTPKTRDEATARVKLGPFVAARISTNKATDRVKLAFATAHCTNEATDRRKLGLFRATGHPAKGSAA